MKRWIPWVWMVLAVWAFGHIPVGKVFSQAAISSFLHADVSFARSGFGLTDGNNPSAGTATAADAVGRIASDSVTVKVPARLCWDLDDVQEQCLVAQDCDQSIQYHGCDGQGSVRYLTDTDTDTYTYDAFGIQIASTGQTPNNYRFAGEQWDEDLGLYYLRARYYHPDLGRFWTMDSYEGSLSDPLSLHKYLYAHNNPVNRFDPTGHYSFGQVMGAIGIASTIAGIAIPTITSGGNPQVLWESSVEAIPVYGNLASAVENFETGHPVAGSFDVAFAVADAFGAKILKFAKLRRIKKVIPGTRGRIDGGWSTDLGRNMGGRLPDKRAHHLIPSAVARNSPLMNRVGIHLDHPNNGIWLPTERHSGFHSAYSDGVARVLANIESRNLPLDDAEELVFKLQLRLRAAINEGLGLYTKQGITADDWYVLLVNDL